MSEFAHLSKQALLQQKAKLKERREVMQSKGNLVAADAAQGLIDEIEALLPTAEDRPEDDGGQGAMF